MSLYWRLLHQKRKKNSDQLVLDLIMYIHVCKYKQARTMTSESFLHIEASKSVVISVLIFTVLNSVSCYCYCAVRLFCFCFCHFTGWIMYQEVLSSYQSYWVQLFLYILFTDCSVFNITCDNLHGKINFILRENLIIVCLSTLKL